MKFFKILPKDLNCRGFQYQEGLNVDSKAINDLKCSNGLHFADASNIMEFHNYGDMIADVEVPEDAIVYNFKNKSKADKIILKNIRPLWEVETLKSLRDDGVKIDASSLENTLVSVGLDVVKYLFSLPGDDNDKRKTIQYHVFPNAVYFGNAEVVEWCMNHCDIPELSKSYELTSAAKYGYLDVVKCLLDNGADIHYFNDNALARALYRNDLTCAKYLIERGADPQTMGESDDICILSGAVKQGDTAKISYLLNLGIGNVNEALLRVPFDDEHIETFRYLINCGADVCYNNDYVLRNSRSIEISKYALEHGADIHARDDEAIEWATYVGSFDLMKLLIEYGADIHTGNDKFVLYTAKNGYFDKTKYLIEKGATSNINDPNILYAAVKWNNLDMVKFLAERGVNVRMKNGWALRYAKKLGFTEIADYLRSVK